VTRSRQTSFSVAKAPPGESIRTKNGPSVS